MEDGISLTESKNRELRVMRFAIQTGLKITQFDLHHGRKQNYKILLKREKHTYLNGQNCVFQYQYRRGQKHPFMWAAMRKGKLITIC